MFLAAIGLIHNISFAQDKENSNPYAIFGSNPYIAGDKTDGEPVKVLIIENIRDNSQIARLEHNTETGIITAFDNENMVVLQKKLKGGERAWPTQDRFAEKYYHLSPYSYGAGNPIRNIDINGDSITVLNFGYGVNQHMAMLIQNDAGKWQYFSINGDRLYNATGGVVGGRPFDDLAVGAFDSPHQFLESSYNSSGNPEDKSINSYGYKEGYILPTTPEQDEIIRNTFTDISMNESYSVKPLNPNHCGTAVQRSLGAVDIETRNLEIIHGRTITNRSTGGDSYTYPTRVIGRNSFLPSNIFRDIRHNNPQGIYIKRNR